MYRERPPKKWFISYIAPFLIIIMIFVWWVFSFKKLFFKENSFNDTYAILNTEKWNTEVMLSWKNEWRNAPAKMKLFKNDAIKTLEKSAFIEIPWDSKIILDKESSIVIENLEADNSFRDVSIMLTWWRIWLDAQRMLNPKSKLLIKLDKVEFTTRWWVFSLESNWIRIIEWEWLVDIIENSKVIWHQSIWVWQELILSETDIKKIALWELPWVSAISDEFRLSDWYRINYKSEAESITEIIKTEKEIKENTWSTITDNAKNNDTISNSSSWKDIINDNNIDSQKIKWSLSIDINDDIIEIKDKSQVYSFSWTVSSNTAIVHVNWWKLTKFKYWDLYYKYNASIAWDNLKEWDNLFKVQSYDKDYKLIDTKEKTLKVVLKIENSKSVNTWSVLDGSWSISSTSDNTISSSWSDISSTSKWTVLQVISPAENEIISWDPIEIKWIAPENTAKIVVWDYELRTFKKWDKNFLYRASSAWWNLVKWDKNTIIITAFDDSWGKIESIKFSFFAEK